MEDTMNDTDMQQPSQQDLLNQMFEMIRHLNQRLDNMETGTHTAKEQPTPEITTNTTPKWNAPTTTIAPAKQPKVQTPDLFYGDRKKLRGFLTQLDIYFTLRPNEFSTDIQRIYFAASYLRGAAANWMEPYLRKLSTGTTIDNLVPLLDTYQQFLQEINKTFGDINETATAERELQRLKQTKSCSLYTTEFRRITSHLSWNEEALIFTYYQGLKDYIKDELSKDERPHTLSDLIEKAVRLDDRIFERKVEKQGHFSSSRPQNQRPPFQPRQHYPSPPDPMDLDASFKHKPSNPAPQSSRNTSNKGKLTMAEKQYRRDNNLCLYCGKAGHRVQDCYSARRAAKESNGDNSISASYQHPRETTPSATETKVIAATGPVTRPAPHSPAPKATALSVSNDHFVIPIKCSYGSRVLQTYAMLDNGATGNFFNLDLVNSLNLPKILKPHAIPVSNIDGTLNKSGEIRYSTPVIRLDIPLRPKHTFTDHLECDITTIKYPIILGLPWIRTRHPQYLYNPLAIRFPINRTATSVKAVLGTTTPVELPVQPTTPISFQDQSTEDITSLVWMTPVSEPLKINGTSTEPTETSTAFLPSAYQDYQNLFDDINATKLPAHKPYDHEIPLAKGTMPPFGPIYSLSELELKTLKKYLEDNLASGFIKPSTSPAGAPILFVKKKDGSLRLCVDYRGLNNITVKNRYALPLISELIDRLSSAKIFTKLDLRGAYNLIRIKQGDEWKTAFRTRYGHYEYQVMPFGLVNAPASFQALMNDLLRPYLDIFVIVYLDDILIYSSDVAKHEEHVKKVLEVLAKANLYCKLEKCIFHATQVDFLGYRISKEGVKMDPAKVKAVQSWPAPTSVKALQSFLGFANYYRLFILNFTSLAEPLHRLLKKGTNWSWGPDQQNAFTQIKQQFDEGKLLLHFDALKPCTLETDASDFAIAGVLYQENATGKLQPVAFYSRKLAPAEANYAITDKELLAIVSCLKHWRCYLEGANFQTTIYCDHSNLLAFTTSKKLSRRQARWSEQLGGFDFIIKHISGAKNKGADLLSRRQDYFDSATLPSTQPLLDASKIVAACLHHSTTQYQPPQNSSELGQPLNMEVPQDTSSLSLIAAATTSTGDITISDSLLSAFQNAYQRDPFTKKALEHLSKSTQTEPHAGLQHFSTTPSGLLVYKHLIYVPRCKKLQLRLLYEHHDTPIAGHFGIAKTFELLSRKFYWPNLRTILGDYISSCTTCQLNKPAREKPSGLLQPLPVPERPWDTITVDFIVKLPPSTQQGSTIPYDSILVIVDKLTKMAHFEACHESMNAQELAWIIFKVIFKYHGIPSTWISDRGSLFTSKFFQEFSKLLGMKQKLSTAYHPQTDGQTERVNAILEQYLRIYCNYKQDNWADLLHMAEFSYNNTVSSTTKETPFYANYGYHPRFQLEEFDTTQNLRNPAAVERISYLKNLQTYLKLQIERAQDQHAQAFNRGVVAPQFKLGEKVYLSRKNIQTTRPSGKLDTKRLGPFKIIRTIGSNAYELKLPPQWSIHPVFHASLLTKAPESSIRPLISEPPPVLVQNEFEYEVEAILDKKQIRNQDYFFIKWKGYPESDNTWEPKKSLQNCTDLLQQFEQRLKTTNTTNKTTWRRP